MCGDALKQACVGKGFGGDAFLNQAPEVIVVAGEWAFPGFIGGAENFLVEEHGFVPEGAPGGHGIDVEGRFAELLWKCIGKIRSESGRLGGLGVGARSHLDFHDLSDIGRGIGEGARICKKQGLLVWVLRDRGR